MPPGRSALRGSPAPRGSGTAPSRGAASGDRTGVKIGHAQLSDIAGDLARWTGDFYAERARDAEQGLPATDVIMMQGDGKGIAMRPEHRRNAGKQDGTRPGIKKMAEI